ncbi:N-acetylmuramoyl-L-alanine amidase [Streptomyces zhihengii]|uniref:N-acetylmuramoyl-L-alanine amidase n=1 Tax=Streptomyces zhihengii TaxID=1818004 RepID=A0ABS2UQ85_9ACTN|nr:N-acetylmuramoyl-L-alanine amidase [Streptomyces zhihengii]MBM9619674.1 N-acetylmuramoyl-L-alanine amidase [Streptomyces zhihengii]
MSLPLLLKIVIASRAEWGAREPKQPLVPVPSSKRTGFVVHYSGAPSSQTVRQIQDYMMDGKDLDDIGYNFMIDVAGRVYEARGWHMKGAHTPNYNTTHIAVCVIGTDEDMLSDFTGKIADRVVKAVKSMYEKANEVMGRTLDATYHGALEGTQCPGNTLRKWVEDGMPGTALEVVDGSSGGNSVGGGSGGGGGYPNVIHRPVVGQQRAVNGLGYVPALTVDGIFGLLTEAGVMWLQRKVGTADDGIWGPGTEAAYLAYVGGYSGGETSVRSTAGQQRAVNGLGYVPALTVDGIFGPLTEAGVMWLQRKVGTADDGSWGPGTEAAYLAHTGQSQDSGIVRSVASQQRAVNGLGYTPRLDVDGSFGPLTVAGVEWLQRRVGADDDGIWGPSTESAYLTHLGHSGSGGRGTTDLRPVSYQQRTVNRLGHRPPLDVDGVFGPLTYAGVCWLQRLIGVADDGMWGSKTEEACNTYLDFGARLTVDGEFGPATIRSVQRVTGATVDGSWGPASKRALQSHLNLRHDAGLLVDGDFGTASVKALQSYLNRMTGAGLPVDGSWGVATTSALQRALNLAKF